jgi:hypothetical protein
MAAIFPGDYLDKEEVLEVAVKQSLWLRVKLAKK